MILALFPDLKRDNLAVREALHVHPILGAVIRRLEDAVPAAWPVGRERESLRGDSIPFIGRSSMDCDMVVYV
jgi:hypothetical protein